MGQETGGAERLSPAEKARQLAARAKEKREREETERQAQKHERYQELKEKIATVNEALASQRQELKEVQDGLDEIAKIERDGIVSDELAELRTQLESDKSAINNKIAETKTALRDLQTDPLHAEMTAIADAKASEIARAEATVKEEVRKKEEHEQNEKALAILNNMIRELTQAIQVAEGREAKLRSLRKEKQNLEQQRDALSKIVEGDMGGVLYTIPETQQRAIQDAVTAARGDGKTIYSSHHFRDDRNAYRPAASTMFTWFDAWREKVKPSFIPFTDRPLRALLAFAEDPRLQQVQAMTEQIGNIASQERDLYTDRKQTNTTFIQNLLAPNSSLLALDGAAFHTLQYADGADKGTVNEKLRELVEVRQKFDILLTDIENDLYNQFKASGFVTTAAIENTLY